MAENYLRPRRGGNGGQGFYEEFLSDSEENEDNENDNEDEELDPVEHENILAMEEDSDDYEEEEDGEVQDIPALEDVPADAPFNLGLALISYFLRSTASA